MRARGRGRRRARLRERARKRCSHSKLRPILKPKNFDSSCSAKAEHPVSSDLATYLMILWLLDRPLSRTMTTDGSLLYAIKSQSDGSLRRGDRCLGGVVLHQRGDTEVIELAGAEHRHLVDHQNFRRHHQVGGAV